MINNKYVLVPAMWSIDERVDCSGKTERIEQIGQLAHCLLSTTHNQSADNQCQDNRH